MSASNTPPARQLLPPFLTAQPFQIPVPQVVFNGYAITHSATEFVGTLSFADRQVINLVMAPVVAKSFALALLRSIEQYEQGTGTTVGTIDELQERLAAFHAAEKP